MLHYSRSYNFSNKLHKPHTTITIISTSTAKGDTEETPSLSTDTLNEIADRSRL